jgi:hypothetical protein
MTADGGAASKEISGGGREKKIQDCLLSLGDTAALQATKFLGVGEAN